MTMAPPKSHGPDRHPPPPPAPRRSGPFHYTFSFLFTRPLGAIAGGYLRVLPADRAWVPIRQVDHAFSGAAPPRPRTRCNCYRGGSLSRPALARHSSLCARMFAAGAQNGSHLFQTSTVPKGISSLAPHRWTRRPDRRAFGVHIAVLVFPDLAALGRAQDPTC